MPLVREGASSYYASLMEAVNHPDPSAQAPSSQPVTSHPRYSAKTPQLLGDSSQAQKRGQAPGSHRLRILKIQTGKISVLPPAQAEIQHRIPSGEMGTRHFQQNSVCFPERQPRPEHQASEGRALAAGFPGICFVICKHLAADP